MSRILSVIVLFGMMQLENNASAVWARLPDESSKANQGPDSNGVMGGDKKRRSTQSQSFKKAVKRKNTNAKIVEPLSEPPVLHVYVPHSQLLLSPEKDLNPRSLGVFQLGASRWKPGSTDQDASLGTSGSSFTEIGPISRLNLGFRSAPTEGTFLDRNFVYSSVFGLSWTQLVRNSRLSLGVQGGSQGVERDQLLNQYGFGYGFDLGWVFGNKGGFIPFVGGSLLGGMALASKTSYLDGISRFGAGFEARLGARYEALNGWELSLCVVGDRGISNVLIDGSGLQLALGKTL